MTNDSRTRANAVREDVEVTSHTVGRVTNDELEQAVAVWFKDEDEVNGETVGPIWIQVGGSVPTGAAPMPQDGRLVPYHKPEGKEWFDAGFAQKLANMLGVEVVWS